MKIIQLFVATCCVVITAHAWDVSENSHWLEGALKGTLSDTLAVRLTEQVRYKEKGDFFYFCYTDFCLQWKFAPNWCAAGAFRYISARKPDSDWSATPMWHINLQNQTTMNWLYLCSRLRLSHVQLDGADNLTDFRPKFSLMPLKGWTRSKLKPYLADELMYNFEQNLIYRNRAEGGILCATYNKLALRIFLMQELTRTDSNTNWSETYNMGAGATLKF